MVTKLLLGLLIFCGVPVAASAITCSVPYTFIQGTPANALQMMANYGAIQSCTNSIDSLNIGPAGIFASQVKPTSTIQAAFGGTVAYTFPAGLNVGSMPVNGPVSSVGAMTAQYVVFGLGSVPANWLASGTAVNTAFHGVFFQIPTGSYAIQSCGPFGSVPCVIVTLSGAATFTSAGTSSVPPSFLCGDAWTFQVGGFFESTSSSGGTGAFAVQVGVPNTIYIQGNTGVNVTSNICWGF